MEPISKIKSVFTPTQYIEGQHLEFPVESLFDTSKTINFIENLFTIMNKQKTCFLSGSYVFEDPTLKLYHSLCGFDLSGRTKLNLTRFGPLTKTHSVFFRNENFITLRSVPNTGYILDEEFNNKLNTFKLVGGKTFDLQYQRTISKSFSYLCDTCCKNARLEEPCNKEYCKNNEESKGVILFYPFRVKKSLEDGSKHIKTYLFLKMEGYQALSLFHSIAAFKRYLLGIEKKQAHDVRREDSEPKDKKKKIKGRFKTLKKIGKFMKHLVKKSKSKSKKKYGVVTRTLAKLHGKTLHLTNNNSDRKIIRKHINNSFHENHEKIVKYIKYNDSFKEKDNKFIKNVLDSQPEKLEEALKNFNFYNENIRSSNEFFVPKEISEKIANEIKANELKIHIPGYITLDEINKINEIDTDTDTDTQMSEQLSEIPYVYYVQKALSQKAGIQLSTVTQAVSTKLDLNLRSSNATPVGTVGVQSSVPIGTGGLPAQNLKFNTHKITFRNNNFNEIKKAPSLERVSAVKK
jgi:hypothetical protein